MSGECDKCSEHALECACKRRNMGNMNEITGTIPNENSELTFHPNANEWAFKINSKGIIFNREKYPDSMPDDFAKCFIDILEKNYDVKFEKIKS